MTHKEIVVTTAFTVTDDRDPSPVLIPVETTSGLIFVVAQ